MIATGVNSEGFREVVAVSEGGKEDAKSRSRSARPSSLALAVYPAHRRLMSSKTHARRQEAASDCMNQATAT